MTEHEMVLNVRYDAPDEIWDKVPSIYQQLDGWLGWQKGLPYWFSYNEDEKHITASVEPSGLQFIGLMDDEEWLKWVVNIKRIASNILGYKVGEVELGEVDS